MKRALAVIALALAMIVSGGAVARADVVYPSVPPVTFDDATTTIIVPDVPGLVYYVSYTRGASWTELRPGANGAICGQYLLVDATTEPGYAIAGDQAPMNHTFPCVGASDCADIYFLGAAGSGQNTNPGVQFGMGSTVYSAYQQMVGAVGGSRRIEPHGLGYAAASVSILTTNPAAYYDSVDIGVTLAQNQIKAERVSCPNTDFVLAGYSQGAMVMHRVIQNLARNGDTATLNHITGVILVGDGDRIADDNVLNYGHARPKSKGIAQWEPGLSAARATKFPASMRSRIASVCGVQDPVCDVQQFTSKWVVQLLVHVGVHTGYPNSKDLSAAVRDLAPRVRQG